VNICVHLCDLWPIKTVPKSVAFDFAELLAGRRVKLILNSLEDSMRSTVLSSLAVLVFAMAVRAEDVAVQTTIESVGLFKNGLAVVERSVELPGAGTFRIEDVPTPVHGTFFIESATAITTRVTTMLVDSPLDLAGAPLQDQLAGKTVSVTLREQTVPIEGTVAVIEPADKNAWNRRYENPNSGGYYLDAYGNRVATAPAGRFIILETKTGRTLIDQNMVSSIQIVGDAKTAKVRKPVLVLKTIDNAPKQTIRISYLTKGLAWAPSYRVQLTDDKKLSLSQNAVVKNELMDLKDVEMFLISGYPSIDFSHVISPLSLQQNWAAFFQQLSMQPGSSRTDNRMVMQQQAVMMNSALPGADGVGAAPPDESIDVHYESIGKQTLGEGDALSLDVAAADADYERIVEWTIPDARNEYGAFYDEYRRRDRPELFDDSAWDAVKFKNPLPFAMTTAPATFTRDAQFLGQQLSKWVNRGEETTLRITKALSIRTRASEQEDGNVDRAEVWVGGRQYRKVTAKGELVIKNFRKTDATIVIKRQFSGELISADDKPEVTLREEGLWSVNRRNEMKWTITLKAGEEKTLKYAYTVLSTR